MAWRNPENRLLVHYESCSGILARRPLLQVGADQFAVIETAGKRIVVGSGISSILRGKLDTKTILWLLKAGYDPTQYLSNLETKLYFVDTKDHRISGNAEVSVLADSVNLDIPFFLTIRLSAGQIQGLFDQAYEWTSDEAVSSMLQETAVEMVREILKLTVINCFDHMTNPDDAEIRRILYGALNPRSLTDLANQVNRELCLKGLALSKRIEIDIPSVRVERIISEQEEEEPAEEPEEEQAVNQEGDFGFFHYRLLPTGGAEITGFRGGISEAVIPEEICGQPVIGIGEDAFAKCDELVSVVLSSGVQRIGRHAFRDCRSLGTVVFPDQTSQIDSWAFARCHALTELTFGKNMAELGDYCFYQCTSLRSVTFPDSLKVIGNFCFSGCSSLSSLKLPGRIEKIWDRAFSECAQLAQVNLPASLTLIGANAFMHCSPQLEISLPLGSYAENWCKANGISYLTPFRWGRMGNTIVLMQYTGNDTEVTVPDSVQGMPVTVIGEKAFWGNTVVRTVHLPEGLKLIGAYAFGRCVRLETIRIPPTVEKIDVAAFSGCALLTEITFPSRVTRIANQMMENCQSLKKVILSSGVIYIGAKSFMNCGSLESAELPTTLYKIGVMAFSNCRSLKEIRIPEGVNEIEPGAFSNCSSLKQAELPQTLTYIGSDVFSGCSSELVCYIQSNQTAEKWCKTQRIKTSRSAAPSAKRNGPADRVCPRCGRKLPPFSSRCKYCG